MAEELPHEMKRMLDLSIAADEYWPTIKPILAKHGGQGVAVLIGLMANLSHAIALQAEQAGISEYNEPSAEQVIAYQLLARALSKKGPTHLAAFCYLLGQAVSERISLAELDDQVEEVVKKYP